MPKKPSSTAAKKPVAKKAAPKKIAKKSVTKTSAPKRATAKKAAPKTETPDSETRLESPSPEIIACGSTSETPAPKMSSRATVLREHPVNVKIGADDPAAIESVGIAAAQAQASSRVKGRRSAVDRLNDPPPETGAALVQRVSAVIDEELNRIGLILGQSHQQPALRVESESRARVLALLARTMKEVMRLRSEGQGADEGKMKSADDDMPRDLDEFRRELSRRLEGMVAATEALPAGDDE